MNTSQQMIIFRNFGAMLFLFLWAFFTLPAFAAISDNDFVKLCGNGTVAEIKQALNNGANANAKDDDGVMALMEASRANSPEVVKVLLGAGAKIDAQDSITGWTPLMQASANNTLDVVEVLLGAGANVNIQDDQGGTALIQAARYNRVEVVETLLKAGAKNLKDNGEHDGTPHDALWYAQESARQGWRKDIIKDPVMRQTEDENVIRLLQDSGNAVSKTNVASEQNCIDAGKSLAGKWEWMERPGARPFFMEITPAADDCRFGVEALWTHSPADHYVWQFSIVWDSANQKFTYENGRHFHRIMPMEDTLRREEIKYEDGTGVLILREGVLLWEDRKEGICADCRFTKGGR